MTFTGWLLLSIVALLLLYDLFVLAFRPALSISATLAGMKPWVALVVTQGVALLFWHVSFGWHLAK